MKAEFTSGVFIHVKHLAAGLGGHSSNPPSSSSYELDFLGSLSLGRKFEFAGWIWSGTVSFFTILASVV